MKTHLALTRLYSTPGLTDELNRECVCHPPDIFSPEDSRPRVCVACCVTLACLHSGTQALVNKEKSVCEMKAQSVLCQPLIKSLLHVNSPACKTQSVPMPFNLTRFPLTLTHVLLFGPDVCSRRGPDSQALTGHMSEGDHINYV